MRLLFGFLFTIAASVGFAQESCRRVLTVKEMKTSGAFAEALRGRNLGGVVLRDGPSDIRSLLKMVNDTLYAGASPKATLEKGELSLAVPLRSGSTIQAEYQGDRRQAGNTRFVMERIALITPSGQIVKLDSAPLSADAKVFSNRGYLWSSETETVDGAQVVSEVIPVKTSDVGDWAKQKKAAGVEIDNARLKRFPKDPVQFLADNQAVLDPQEKRGLEAFAKNVETASFPRVIEGSDMREFANWIRRIESLTREDLESLDLGKGLGVLRVKSSLRSNVAYARNVVKKQGFKYALIGAIFYLYTNSDQLKNWAADRGLIEARLDTVSGGYLSRPEYTAIADFLHSFGKDKEFDDLSKVLKEKLSSKRPSPSEDFSAHHALLARLMALEASQTDGRMNVFEATEGGSRDFMPELKRGSVVYTERPATLQNTIFLTQFEKKKVIAVTLVRSEKTLAKVKTVLIRQRQYPEIYQELLKLEKAPNWSKSKATPAAAPAVESE